MVNIVDENSFDRHVLNARGMVLVNFWSRWSAECLIMSSLMHNMAHFLDKQDLIVQVDWDQQKRLARWLEVFGVPTLLIYSCGSELGRYSGTMSKDDLMKQLAETKSRVA